jgi:hypothetical protein
MFVERSQYCRFCLQQYYSLSRLQKCTSIAQQQYLQNAHALLAGCWSIRQMISGAAAVSCVLQDATVTCADTNLTSNGSTPHVCPVGWSLKANASSIVTISDGSCCVSCCQTHCSHDMQCVTQKSTVSFNGCASAAGNTATASFDGCSLALHTYYYMCSKTRRAAASILLLDQPATSVCLRFVLQEIAVITCCW